MVQNIVCTGAFLFCVLFSCLRLCASEITWSPSVAAGDGHVVAETSGEAQRCHSPIPGIGRVLLQKSSSRIQLQSAQPEEGKSEPSFEHASSIAPVASSRALAVVVDEGQQKSEEKTRASVSIGEDQVRTRFLVQRIGVGLVLVSIFVLSFVCLIVFCMKRPQEDLKEKHENFDPWLSPRQVDGRQVYTALRTPAPIDTSHLPALSSHHFLPQTFRPLAQFGTSFPSHLHLRQEDYPASVANSLMSSSQVPTARSSIGRPCIGENSGRFSIGSHCSVLSSHIVRLSAAQSPRYSTAAITPRFSTPPNSTSPRMRPQSSSTIATQQQVAVWRAEIQARVAAATGEEVARRKIMARGGLLGGDGRVGAAIARSLSPNGDTCFITKLPMRARTTSPQGQPQHDAADRLASRMGLKRVPGLGSFFNTPRHGANIFDAACDAFQDL